MLPLSPKKISSFRPIEHESMETSIKTMKQISRHFSLHSKSVSFGSNREKLLILFQSLFRLFSSFRFAYRRILFVFSLTHRFSRFWRHERDSSYSDGPMWKSDRSEGKLLNIFLLYIELLLRLHTEAAQWCGENVCNQLSLIDPVWVWYRFAQFSPRSFVLVTSTSCVCTDLMCKNFEICVFLLLLGASLSFSRVRDVWLINFSDIKNEKKSCACARSGQSSQFSSSLILHANHVIKCRVIRTSNSRRGAVWKVRKKKQQQISYSTIVSNFQFSFSLSLSYTK